MFNKEEIANIILHVTLISTFIGIFFFTYASRIEENIVKKQVAFLIEDNREIISLIPNDIKQNLVSKLNDIKLDLSEDDNKTTEQNKKLLLNAAKILSVVLIVGVYIVLKMSHMYNFNFVHLLKENLIILCFVALTEFVFLTFFVQHYLSIDPNIIKRKFITIISGNNSNTNSGNNINIDKIQKQLYTSGINLNNSGINLNNILGDAFNIKY